MKDHEKRELVNALTKVAVEFAGTQQLRERIAQLVLPALEPLTPKPESSTDKSKRLQRESEDRSLMEMAAKAAGLKAQYDCPERGMMRLSPCGFDTVSWHPLENKEDAEWLRETLKLEVTDPKYPGFGTSCGNQTVFMDDPVKQRCRAIVRAAVEEAKEMP